MLNPFWPAEEVVEFEYRESSLNIDNVHPDQLEFRLIYEDSADLT
jgi:hypothetical protein